MNASQTANPGDGLTWATAFKTLQEALTTATSCSNVTQIWVAKGTYYPDEGPGQTNNDRNAAFSMKNGVAIYGGFAGNEAADYDLSQRNFSTNPTILSGDIDGVADGVTGSGSSLTLTGNGGNAYHVISNASGLTNSAILDGFTVSGGNANGTIPNNGGGGMRNDGGGTGNFCSPTVRNCTFLHNSASAVGGAVFNRGLDPDTGIGDSSPLFSNCTFTANASSAHGGALHQNGSGTTSYTDCVFSSNRANFGGAITYSTQGTATAAHTFLTCSFTGNYAGTQGGAILNGFSFETGTRTVSMTNCSFTDNATGGGGGGFSNGVLFTAGDTPVFFTNCVFKNNVAHNGSNFGSGGAFQSGGGLTTQRATFTNCLLEGNKALGTADDGGGAIMIYSGTVTLLNSTLTNNQSATRGGGISILDNTGSVSGKNLIFWNNPAATANTNSLANGNGSSASVEYSLLQEAACPATVTCGAGMLYNQNPRFVNAATGNFQLAACSPAINAGTNAGAPPNDLLGNPRPLTEANPADLGAYEFGGTPGFSVSITPSGPTTFCSGGSVTLSAGTYSSYVWKNGDTQVSTDPTFVATAPGSYTVTVTDGSCTATSSPVVVTVTPPVFTQQPTLPQNLVVCANGSVSISFNVNCPGSGPFTAQLSNPGGTFTSGTQNLGTVTPGVANPLTIPGLTPTTSANYRIRILSNQPGFHSDSTGAFRINALTFGSTPTVNLTAVCAGASIRVSFTVNANCAFLPGNAFSAELSDGSGSFASPVVLGTVSPGINTLTVPQTIPTGSGYRVRIRATAPALLSATSAAFTVNQPTFASTPSVSGDNKCAGEAVRLSFSVGCAFFAGNTFTAQLSNASGVFAASPPSLGTVTPGALNNVVIPAGTPAGTGYKIRIVSSNPVVTSAASANFRVKACANREVAPEETGLRVTVSPNPSPEGKLRIVVTGAEGQALRVELFNGGGQSVREGAIGQAAEEEILTWDVSRQPQGLYLLRVSGEKESKTIKVLH